MVCRSVFSYQSGAVQAKYDGEAEQGDVMDDIIVCPLHEGGVDVAERLHSFFSHTARESGCMPFGNTHIEGTVGHGVHQLVHGAAGGHGGGYSDDFRIFLCQFYQRFPKHVLEKRRQIAGIRLEAFSGFRIELARCMPDIGILLGRFEAFSFYSVQMQYFRSLHIFDVPQDTGYVFHIVSVDRAEVADVHPFKDILLLGGH